MDNDSHIIKSLEKLKEMGVYLSVDNFGTSYTRLNCLTRYPLDELRIDRSLVADCDHKEDNAKLVKAIIAMTNSLDLRAVAEGVETQGEYQFLVDNGVRVMQGFLFSKAVPAQELQQQLLIPWHFMAQIQRMALSQELVS